MKVTRLNPGQLAYAWTAAAVLLAGCSGYDDDAAYYTYGEPYYYTSDYYYMGSVYDPYYYYYKRSAAAPDTLPGETLLEPLTYHPECTCYVRRATYTGEVGYARDRTDTVYFFDSAGAAITGDMTTAKAFTVRHKRHVVSSVGDRDADIVFDVTGNILRDSVPMIDTVTMTDTSMISSIWNGTISGTFNGQAIQNGIIDSVVRPWKDTAFSYPESGRISLEGEQADLLIEFQPDSTADVTINSHRNGEVYNLTVDSDFRESAPRVD